MKPKILVIVGPTASGKSNLAVLLAKKFGGEVVSADSRQVYRGLNIGSGKVTTKEMAGVTHHLLSIASPKRVYSVAQYQVTATRVIADILKRGKRPIICGGTGQYVQSIVDGLSLPLTSLKNKIEIRLLKRLKQGMIAEVKKLRADGLSWKRLESFGLEYRYLARFLQNKITRTKMIAQLSTEITHYAKRQMTWFKKDRRIIWVTRPAEAEKLVKKFLD
ncbi:MAG: tRNA (adenosine(37)-N6)-dimethylallyltransferase MiaA [Candidatus Vogelbacteria bacterium]|nr:tRNA (adenosine(37)-N6)-dimethylallyltransferase MiaA [Candidatus Vogelbacteria bacterium]